MEKMQVTKLKIMESHTAKYVDLQDVELNMQSYNEFPSQIETLIKIGDIF